LDAHIKKVYAPMTETGFYILLCLRKEAHGYSIVREVDTLTNGEIKISPGTLYGSLSKMEKDGLIRFVREEEKRRIYRITELGQQVLELEMKRIDRLYHTMLEVR
jgi:DNA-binding PadR family transcriptional regulator